MFRQPSLSLSNRVVDLEGVQYRVVEQVGDGSYSDVYKVQRLTDSNFFAIKKIRVLRGNQDAEAHLQNERYAASKLGKHPHIVSLFEIKEHALPGGGQGDKEVFLLYELCPGKCYYQANSSFHRGQPDELDPPENEPGLERPA